MSTKYVYTFGDGKAEGKADMKNLLGGKGANLAEMNLIGLPVPAGFTITTEVCTLYNQKGKDAVVKLIEKFKKVVDKLEKVCIIVRVENNSSGPLVKGLRHRLFTAVTRVRIPYGLWYVADGTLDEKRLKKFQKSVDKRKHL